MKKNSLKVILPVMFGFFIMGLVDIIGISTSYIKNDFPDLTDGVANLISLSCFFWFFLLSVPTGMLMNRIGRKRTVLLSFFCTALAMLVPLIDYSFTFMLVAFSLVGIGNTLLQVSVNPLVTNVVTSDKVTGVLTLGQFTKAICSLIGPILAAAFIGSTMGWKTIFPVFAALSLVAFVWLAWAPVEEEQKSNDSQPSIKQTFSLFGDPMIVAYFIGIAVLVGVDVGINVTFPKLLMERSQLSLAEAGMGNSVYFFARTVGAFLGGMILLKFSDRKFYILSTCLALCGLLLLFASTNVWYQLACIALFGLGYSNLFAIVFSRALRRAPDRANEVSALLIAGLVGGAILPPLVGWLVDITTTQLTAVAAIAVVWLYMLWLVRKVKD